MFVLWFVVLISFVCLVDAWFGCFCLDCLLVFVGGLFGFLFTARLVLLWYCLWFCLMVLLYVDFVYLLIYLCVGWVYCWWLLRWFELIVFVLNYCVVVWFDLLVVCGLLVVWCLVFGDCLLFGLICCWCLLGCLGVYLVFWFGCRVCVVLWLFTVEFGVWLDRLLCLDDCL